MGRGTEVTLLMHRVDRRVMVVNGGKKISNRTILVILLGIIAFMLAMLFYRVVYFRH